MNSTREVRQLVAQDYILIVGARGTLSLRATHNESFFTVTVVIGSIWTLVSLTVS